MSQPEVQNRQEASLADFEQPLVGKVPLVSQVHIVPPASSQNPCSSSRPRGGMMIVRIDGFSYMSAIEDGRVVLRRHRAMRTYGIYRSSFINSFNCALVSQLSCSRSRCNCWISICAETEPRCDAIALIRCFAARCIFACTNFQMTRNLSLIRQVAGASSSNVVQCAGRYSYVAFSKGGSR